ncbi:MAG: tRNA-dihydrouridine synthase family protein [Lachnospiraceae bacterium]|nr:tRNA-dihydrouridine synthase family protein [Lachnospiraceae bacterium]
MKIYMAPIEGIGGHIYRSALEEFFPGADGYFAPFIGSGNLNNKEIEDLKPENNRLRLTPQVMSNNADQFMEAVSRLMDFGCDHVNLNLGCPSGTVTSKRRGAGALENPDELDRLLCGIYEKCPIPVSIKTRIGMDTYENWEWIMQIINSYPVSELTVHPRTRKDFYKGPIHMEAFKYACEHTDIPLVYNGEIRSRADYDYVCEMFPNISGVMIGREELRRPWFIASLKTGQEPDRTRLRAFHDALLDRYGSELSGESHLLFKMKDLWAHLGEAFAGVDKPLKKLKKSTRLSDYRAAVLEIFENGELVCGDLSLRDYIANP